MPATKRVLFVGDSTDEREMYAELFRRHGFCTLQASSAADAFRLATDLAPEAVVTDVRLAGPEDGFGLTRRLKQNAHTQQVPVVVLTGYVFTHDRTAAERAGCDSFVAKPCLPDTLWQIVGGLIARRDGSARTASLGDSTGSV